MGSTELRNRCFMKLSKSDKQATLACDKTAQGADSWGTTTLKTSMEKYNSWQSIDGVEVVRTVL